VVGTVDELRTMCEEMVAGREGARFEIDDWTANVLSADAPRGHRVRDRRR
jgi:hypothetical protein